MRRAAARVVALASTSLLLAACVHVVAGSRDPVARRAEIAAMLDNAARNWNRGDLDAFVSDYMPGDQTTYVGGRGVQRGPAAIRASYAPRFAPGAVRDSLYFEIVDVDPLEADLTHVIATYFLARRVNGRDSVTARGPTSLLMRRVDGRWRIVHDHSS